MQNKELQKIIEESRNIVLFTGAGISCGSGIPDFRSANGLYSEKKDKIEYSPEEIISHDFLWRHTDLFYSFYKAKMVYPEAKPNTAHLFFADLEKQGKLKAVVTQNIDGLHSAAGNKNVFELHGSVHRNYCVSCGEKYDLGYILQSDGIPKCRKCGGTVRPDVVLYGEGLDEDVWQGAAKAISEADCLIVVGTSLTVYPAANMLRYFNGKNLVLINKQKTPFDNMANLVINEDVEKVLSAEQAAK